MVRHRNTLFSPKFVLTFPLSTPDKRGCDAMRWTRGRRLKSASSSGICGHEPLHAAEVQALLGPQPGVARGLQRGARQRDGPHRPSHGCLPSPATQLGNHEKPCFSTDAFSWKIDENDYQGCSRFPKFFVEVLTDFNVELDSATDLIGPSTGACQAPQPSGHKVWAEGVSSLKETVCQRV